MPPVTSIIRFVVAPIQIVVSPLKTELVGPTCEIAILDRNKEVINTENIKLNRIKFVNKIRHLYLTHFKLLVGKREYYKFDIVKLFNGYQMFVCPEEICDLPGIGFIEGMACGCLY